MGEEYNGLTRPNFEMGKKKWGDGKPVPIAYLFRKHIDANVRRRNRAYEALEDFLLNFSTLLLLPQNTYSLEFLRIVCAELNMFYYIFI